MSIQVFIRVIVCWFMEVSLYINDAIHDGYTCIKDI